MSFFSSKGSIEQRKYRLGQLRALSPTAKSIDFMKLPPQAFAVVEERALREARDNAMNSGRLFVSTERDDTGRKITTFEGDPKVCWEPFMAPGVEVRINKNAGTHEETMRVRDGQRVVVVNE